MGKFVFKRTYEKFRRPRVCTPHSFVATRRRTERSRWVREVPRDLQTDRDALLISLNRDVTSLYTWDATTSHDTLHQLLPYYHYYRYLIEVLKMSVIKFLGGRKFKWENNIIAAVKSARAYLLFSSMWGTRFRIIEFLKKFFIREHWPIVEYRFEVLGLSVLGRATNKQKKQRKRENLFFPLFLFCLRSLLSWIIATSIWIMSSELCSENRRA